VVLLAGPVRARRLTEDEGRRLHQIVRRGKHESIRVRRAMIIMRPDLRLLGQRWGGPRTKAA
jgi:hypothetical protein